MKSPKEFNNLSKRQKNMLTYMDEYVGLHGYPPTIREIGEATGINSTSVVNYNLNKLVDAGFLERSDRVSRGMRLIKALPNREKKAASKTVQFTDAALRIQLYGQIVAGQPLPVYSDTNAQDAIEVTPFMLGHVDTTDAFALRVKGDSMIDALIADGDIVILRKQETANNGDMVAVWLPERGETTLKYFYREGERIRLQPANPQFVPIEVNAAQCEVQGKVLSVIRPAR
jgi:repressor LexA